MADNSVEISCSNCERKFTAKGSLYRHIRNFHPNEDSLQNKGNRCPLCNCSSSSVKKLQNHIKTNHSDIKLNFDTLFFYSLSEFREWKTKIERETLSSFIKRRQDKVLTDGRTVTYYYCHRSGEFNTKSSGKRRLKVLGSHKVGFTCPANMTVYREVHNDAIEIEVHFQTVHLGHKCEVGRIPLSAEEKQRLSSCLQLGIPKSAILENVRKKFSPTKRIAHTTRKDLHNICRDFKIDNEIIIDKGDTTPNKGHVKLENPD